LIVKRAMATATPPSATERFIGRAVACCVHPYASWRRLPASGRAGLLAAYAGIGYVTMIGLLFIG
jgi:hypothetical protein